MTIERDKLEDIIFEEGEDRGMVVEERAKSQQQLRDGLVMERPTFLIIESEPLYLLELSEKLEDRGIQCDKVMTGREGLDLTMSRFVLAKQQRAKMYRVIILPYSMPKMDGLQTAIAIKTFFREQ